MNITKNIRLCRRFNSDNFMSQLEKSRGGIQSSHNITRKIIIIILNDTRELDI